MGQQQLKVFVSHNHNDNAFCHTLVHGLRQAGIDVWYDEHNMGLGQIRPTIEHELRERPVFVVILSPAALRSQWVEDEARWAYSLFRRDRSRRILPITAAAIREDDIWLFLEEFRRIEAPGLQPYPPEEAARRAIPLLTHTPAGEAAAPIVSQSVANFDDLIASGKALQAQCKHAEALPFFERATQLAAGSFSAWSNLGYTLNELKRYQEAMPAHKRATTLDSLSTAAWYNKGLALYNLNLHQEALVAYDRAGARCGGSESEGTRGDPLDERG